MDHDYRAINRAAWNSRTPIHMASAFYDLPGFLAGQSSLREIELALLGDLQGLEVLHLQCHFGQDTLSLARLGAKVTGVDLSDVAIAAAEGLAAQLSLPARFICSDLYALPAQLDATFDLVFSSYGTIGWLPDLDRWAAVVARYLRPGGRFVFVEFHPVLWMYDDACTEVTHRYFRSAPIVETTPGTYAEPGHEASFASVTWNHGLAEVISSLLGQGLRLDHFSEYDYSPYDIFAQSEAAGPGRYRVAAWGDKVPLVYALVMRREG